MLKDIIPELYHPILGEEFLHLNPEEKIATCADCYKLKKSTPLPHFSAQTKCCTYYPFLPNYLVGQALSSSSEGATRIKNLILQRRFVIPVGLCAPPGYQTQFNHKAHIDFGNRFDLLCPFYETTSGGCTVWQNRGHECSTYFCKSSYGEKGEAFWLEVRNTLFELEMFLSQMAMLELGFSNQHIDENLAFIKNHSEPQRTDWQMSALEWSKVWSYHFENIEDYFIRSFQFVKDHAVELKIGWHENRHHSSRAHSKFLSTLIVGGEVSGHH